MKRLVGLTALLLAVCMLFGCGNSGIHELAQQYLGTEPTESTEMAYLPPDMQAHDALLEKACQAAETEENILILMNRVYDYYDAYDRIYAAHDLSYINYCRDVTDTEWEAAYNECAELISQVDAGLDRLYCCLAKSPIREKLEADSYFGEGFFDAYEEESLWDDPELMALLDREAELLEQYYALYTESDSQESYTDSWFETYEPQLGALYVELIGVRQQIAACFDYDSYPAFAYDFYHYRDYTPEQAEAYLQAVDEALGDLYAQVNESDVWELGWETSTESETLSFVKNMANAMGGDVADAFKWMEDYDLYDIALSENKFPICFELYILYYYQPYVFLCPDGTVYDKLTFAHEFGHFAADYVTGGTYAGTDVTEVHSQAMEYLSLFYGEDTNSLRALKLADSLTVYAEQAAYSLFEHQVYGLEGDALTLENVRALYREIGTEFGFEAVDWDSRDYVTIPHLYEQPLYMISYVVSNDLAMQIYALEEAQSGAGLAVYNEILYSDQSYIVSFAEEYGLESPFAKGRLETVRKTFEKILN